ncbi:MAG: phosphoribosylamine--glycine ligase [Candidatus Roizmanbacteria bacterium]|nr:phosphoribosylamine--glycine ligase [Candidatus Roizmanbacteria bacterium]
MKKILLLGNGAREHVIAETFLRSADRPEIFVVGKTKNPGLAKLATDYLLADVCDRDAIREFAHKVGPDFAFVGPEAPIAYGITDMLLEMGIKSASPLQTVGRLESSKSFTRNLLEKYAIHGNPKYKVFFSEDGIREFLESLEGNYVVKADGLKGGKGVKVSGDHLATMDEGVMYAKECILECGKVVIEEKFIGQEFSLMSFCDGENTKEMPAVQDHKRAFDGDFGPNTGGMGTYSCADHSMPFLTESDIRQASDITRLVAKALKEETQSHFKGVMYGGFIAVKDGVRLIEYNARFGDPEAMNVLPLLKSDFVEICESIIVGDLNNVKVEFENKATVCKYVVPNGYPDSPIKGERIEIGKMPEGVKVYFASVDEKEDGLYLAGSRAVAVVGIGDDVSAAEKLAEEGVNLIKGPVFHRKDIGTKELIESKVEMMKEIRG